MYIKIERVSDKRVGKRFTFFSRKATVNGEQTDRTDKMVFGNISESIKEGEMHGKPVYRYDSWSATFCGKAYEKALTLTDKAHIDLYEFTITNRYNENTKKSYPSIMVFDFDIISDNAEGDVDTASDEGFMQISDADMPDFLKE